MITILHIGAKCKIAWKKFPILESTYNKRKRLFEPAGALNSGYKKTQKYLEIFRLWNIPILCSGMLGDIKIAYACSFYI